MAKSGFKRSATTSEMYAIFWSDTWRQSASNPGDEQRKDGAEPYRGGCKRCRDMQLLVVFGRVGALAHVVRSASLRGVKTSWSKLIAWHVVDGVILLSLRSSGLVIQSRIWTGDNSRRQFLVPRSSWCLLISSSTWRHLRPPQVRCTLSIDDTMFCAPVTVSLRLPLILSVPTVTCANLCQTQRRLQTPRNSRTRTGTAPLKSRSCLILLCTPLACGAIALADN